MADNYLENHYEQYLKRKEDFLRRKRGMSRQQVRNVERPDDESL